MTLPPWAPIFGPENLIDDNEATFAHTQAAVRVGDFVEIDLGADTDVGSLYVKNREGFGFERRIEGTTFTLLNEARQPVWTRDFLHFAHRYTFPLNVTDPRMPPTALFVLDASAPGTLFSDADGRVPAAAGGTVRHWRSRTGSVAQSLTLGRDARWLPNAFGSSRPGIALGGAAGTYALPTLAEIPNHDGVTMVVACAIDRDAPGGPLGGGGHPWLSTSDGIPRASQMCGTNDVFVETFHSSGAATFGIPYHALAERIFVYAVVANSITGYTTTQWEDTAYRSVAAYQWRGREPARMSPWNATLAEFRLYQGALGDAELSATIAELKAKWGSPPTAGAASRAIGPYGCLPWGTTAAFAVPTAQWIYGPGDPASTGWTSHRHECAVTTAAAHRAVLHVLAEDRALVRVNDVIHGVTPDGNWLTPSYPRYTVDLSKGHNVLRFDLENAPRTAGGLCAALVHADTGAVLAQTTAGGWSWGRNELTPGFVPTAPPATTGAASGAAVSIGASDAAQFGRGAFIVPTAEWVWTTATAAAGAPSHEPITFRGTFTAAAAGSASVYMYCDDVAVPYMNGQAMGGYVRWAALGKWRVPVVAGANELAVVALNTGGPAGLLVGVISDSDGTTLTQTNATWRFVRH